MEHISAHNEFMAGGIAGVYSLVRNPTGEDRGDSNDTGVYWTTDLRRVLRHHRLYDSDIVSELRQGDGSEKSLLARGQSDLVHH